MSKLVEQMVRAVRDGFTPRSVYEATLTYHPGSTVKVNKDTHGALFPEGGDVTVAKGEVVSIVGVGSGPTGTDHLVQLPDGRKATIPFYDLGESILQSRRPRTEDSDEPATHEDEPTPSEDDAPTHADDPDKDEDDDERIVRVHLAKPLSAEAEDWLKSGHKESDVELPELPEDDQPDSVSFLMKAKDQEALGNAIGSLKKVAAENIQKIEPASKDEWQKS